MFACNHEHDRTPRIQLVADFPEYLQKESISATCDACDLYIILATFISPRSFLRKKASSRCGRDQILAGVLGGCCVVREAAVIANDSRASERAKRSHFFLISGRCGFPTLDGRRSARSHRFRPFCGLHFAVGFPAMLASVAVGLTKNIS